MLKKNSQTEYKVIVEKDEDGYLVATVPALPGCYTQAKSPSVLMKRVKDAIKLCLKVAENDAGYRQKMKLVAYEPTFVGLQVVRM